MRLFYVLLYCLVVTRAQLVHAGVPGGVGQASMLRQRLASAMGVAIVECALH